MAEPVTPEEQNNPPDDAVQREIDEKLSAALGEPVKGGKVVEDEQPEPKPADKPEVTEPDPKQGEIKVEAPKPEPEPVDREKIAAEERQKVTDSIIQAITGEKKEEDQEELSPWAKEGRTPKDYDEIAAWAAQQAQTNLQRQVEEQQRTVAEQQKAQEETAAEHAKQMNGFWDAELEQLQASGKIPAIKDEKDESDPGVKARKALFQAMYDEAAKGTPVSSLKLIYYEHYKDPNAQPAGADAPISAAARPGNADDGDSFSYADIHGKSVEDIAAGR